MIKPEKCCVYIFNGFTEIVPEVLDDRAFDVKNNANDKLCMSNCGRPMSDKIVQFRKRSVLLINKERFVNGKQ